MGTCSGINLSPELAFIGLYAVRPELQGLGIGSQLWHKVMQHIGSERNVGLYALPLMADKYKNKYNFSMIPKKQIMKFEGKFKDNYDLIENIDGISLVSINEDNIQKVIQYDKEVCEQTMDRTVLLTQLYKTAETVNLLAINESNEVMGYCFICVKSKDFCSVEPLYADNERIAELLVNKCCQLLTETKTNGLIYYCWDNNHKSIAIAEKLNLELIQKRPTLYTKKVIEGNSDKIFCVQNRAFYPF